MDDRTESKSYAEALSAPPSAQKKVLFFTRIENDTGGDQTLLFMVFNALLANIPEGSAIHLILVYDHPSTSRARAITDKWGQMAHEKHCTYCVWRNYVGTKHPGPTKLNVDICKKVMNNGNWSSLLQFIPTLDMFVVAGWAHQLNKDDAKYMQGLLHLPPATKLLLCAPPGKRIQSNFLDALARRGYRNVFSLQPGLESDDAGLPMPASLSRELMENASCREQWVAHLRNHAPGAAEGLGSGEARGDKLIVIYCSKDLPGKGRNSPANQFMLECERNGAVLNEYHVILIGANSNNDQAWITLCNVFAVKSVTRIERTESSEVLMRSLRDAEYSMATGSFSILEARNMGISHCAYLCPQHLNDLNEMLLSASAESLGEGFIKGNQALIELEHLPESDFEPQILRKHVLVVPTERRKAGTEMRMDSKNAAARGQENIEEVRKKTSSFKTRNNAARANCELSGKKCDTIQPGKKTLASGQKQTGPR